MILAGNVFSQELACANVSSDVNVTESFFIQDDLGESSIVSDDPWSYKEYKLRLRMEKGAFLDQGSLAYYKYKNYQTLKWCGWSFLAAGFVLAAPVGIPVLLCLGDVRTVNFVWGDPVTYWDNNYVPGIICMSIGGGLMVAGAIMLGCTEVLLKQSYQYYIQGQQKTATINWQPAIGAGHVGVGMTLRF